MNFLNFILFLILVTGSSSTRSINLSPENDLYVTKNNSALLFNINNTLADDEVFSLNTDFSDETGSVSIDVGDISSSYFEFTCFTVYDSNLLNPLHLNIPPPSCS